MAFGSANTELSSLAGIIVVVAEVVIFVGAEMIVVDKCCDIIDVLPSVVLRWVNIHAGGEKGDLDSHVTAMFGNFKQEMRGAAQTGIGSGAKKSKGADPKGPGGNKSGGDETGAMS